MIDFVNVTKIFQPDKTALDRVNFSIDPGEFVFMTGHSGSGKTTLLRLFLRELRPTEGKVYFNDQDLSELSNRKVAKHRQKVGVVFQDYKLLDDLTVWENIALPLIIAHQSQVEIESRIGELLKMLKLTGRENDFPVQLSGGEAQRVSLARALSVAPKVIFADEPTGNLDEENSDTICTLLRAINKYGTTVVFATHNLGFIAKNPDARHLEFDAGKLIKDSQPKKVTAETFAPEEKPAVAIKEEEVEEEKKEVIKEEKKPEEEEKLKAEEAFIAETKTVDKTKTEKKSPWFSWGKKKEKPAVAIKEEEVEEEKKEVAPIKETPPAEQQNFKRKSKVKLDKVEMKSEET